MTLVWRGQKGRRLVVIPASPIVPRNEDGRAVPKAAPIGILARTFPNGVDNRSYPGRTASKAGISGVVGILSSGNHPGHVRELASADVPQHIRGVENDIIFPLQSGALLVITVRHA